MTDTITRTAGPARAGLLPAVGYLRLSDSRIEGELDLRITKLNTEAEALGWYLTEIIMERDDTRRNSGVSAYKQVVVRDTRGAVTGMATIRPGFDQLVDGLFSGRYQRVLTEDVSRLMRRGRDNERLIDAAEFRGADVLSLSGTIQLHRGGSDPERQMARIMASMAEQFSRDMSRRVTGGRERHAATSWGGGRRPFGFTPDLAAPKHHKTLIVVEAEAAVIRKAAEDVLAGVSLNAITRDLRERAALGEPGTATVTNTPWQTRSLRGALTSGAVAGYLVRKGEIVADAPWAPILDRETWQRVRDLFADENRRTNRGSGNAPKWLLSGFAQCGVCGKPLTIGRAGAKKSPVYIGKVCGHVSRVAIPTDQLVSDAVVGWLKRWADSDRLRPQAPAADQHAKALRAELARLRKQRTALLEMFDGDPDALGVIRGKEARMAQLDTMLAATVSTPDPLALVRDGDPAEVWAALPVARKRVIVQALIARLVIHKAPRTGQRFDPSSIVLEWTPQAEGVAA